MRKQGKFSIKGNYSISQNFLRWSSLADKLLTVSGIPSGGVWLDIGVGTGVITSSILKYNKGLGSVIGLEIDPLVYEKARQNLAENKGNLSLYNMDIMHFDFSRYSRLKIFSNIPFSITSEILKLLVRNSDYISDMVIFLEEPVADSLIPYRDRSGRSIVRSKKGLDIYPIWLTSYLYRFSATDFEPVPQAKVIAVKFKKKNSGDVNIIKWRAFVDKVVSDPFGIGFWRSAYSRVQLEKIALKYKIKFGEGISTIPVDAIFECFNILTKLNSDRYTL